MSTSQAGLSEVKKKTKKLHTTELGIVGVKATFIKDPGAPGLTPLSSQVTGSAV